MGEPSAPAWENPTATGDVKRPKLQGHRQAQLRTPTLCAVPPWEYFLFSATQIYSVFFLTNKSLIFEHLIISYFAPIDY